MSAVIALLIARADNGVIGADGGLPWRIKEDMKRVKRLTLGKPVLMGRKTWESLPKRPLPGRPNVVVTRDESFEAEGAHVAHDVSEALALGREIAARDGADEVIVFGGAEIYRRALPEVERVYLTEVHAEPEGDTTFPPFTSDEWEEVAREDHEQGEDDSAAYSFVTLERRHGL